ncbi:MAG: efflux RND transporter periplasmic adaptor subunit [Candidatus Cloacimonetes bacterium]|nr:efflux RND transporter periplasmic adaptor subunit [Candidatus Cloacimonadota bacterium]
MKKMGILFSVVCYMGLICSKVIALPAKATTVLEMDVMQKLQAVGTTSPEHAVSIRSTVTEKIVQMPFRDGDRVKKGDILVILEKSEEEAQLIQAKAQLAEQERELKRIESLVRQKTLPSAQLDEQRTKLEEAKATVAVNEARIADRVIAAPFDGVLGFREFSVGALLTPGDIITTLDKQDVMQLDFPVPERHLASIVTGQEIEAHSISYPGKTFKGKVTAVDSRVDPGTRTARVRAQIPNPSGMMRSGMLMTLELTTSVLRRLVIPEASLFQIQRQHFVFRVKDDMTVERVSVVIAERQDGMVSVLEGLKAGDKVIAEGSNRLRPGMKVELLP